MYKLLAQHYEKEETGYMFSFVYLHGKIEKINGYDIVTRTDDVEIPFGIHPVKVDINGKEYDCKLFLWNSKSDVEYNREKELQKIFAKLGKSYTPEPDYLFKKGLVVLNGDKKALKDAYKKYKGKRCHI